MRYRGTYIQVDLSAIADNTRALRAAVAPVPHMMAVVKANAYGHGLVPVAQTALQNGADWLGVAIPEEGQLLREAGVTAPILVLGAVNAAEAEACARYDLTAAVFDAERVRLLEAAAQKQGKTVSVHLKCDTGMGRIGVRNAEEAKAVLSALENAPHVRLTGAFTHFADADGQTEDYSLGQIAAFETLLPLLPPGLLIHAAASAASLRYPQARYGMVRQGISLYGCAPVPQAPPLRPALSWHTEISYVKALPAGACVSYGCAWRAERETRVATLPVGYGDGYHRAMSGKARVLIGGVRCPVIGRICMDQIMADVTEVPEKEIFLGADCVLLGRQGRERITAEEMAQWAGTIPYEVLLAPTACRTPVYHVTKAVE